MAGWLIAIGLSLGAVGFWAYTYELIQGKITMKTEWKELTIDQFSYFVMAVAGLLVFLIGLFNR